MEIMKEFQGLQWFGVLLFILNIDWNTRHKPLGEAKNWAEGKPWYAAVSSSCKTHIIIYIYM